MELIIINLFEKLKLKLKDSPFNPGVCPAIKKFTSNIKI